MVKLNTQVEEFGSRVKLIIQVQDMSKGLGFKLQCSSQGSMETNAQDSTHSSSSKLNAINQIS